MWQRARPYVLALSLALNVPFVVAWGVHAVGHPGPESGPAPGHRRPPPFPGHKGPPDERMIERMMMESVGVTDAQWEKMKDRQHDFHVAMDKSFRESERLQGKLMDLIAAPELDRKAVDETQEQAIEVQRQRMKLMLDQLLADKRDLTPEQQQRLFDRMRHVLGSDGFGPGRHRRPGPGGPPRPDDHGRFRDSPDGLGPPFGRPEKGEAPGEERK